MSGALKARFTLAQVEPREQIRYTGIAQRGAAPHPAGERIAPRTPRDGFANRIATPRQPGSRSGSRRSRAEAKTLECANWVHRANRHSVLGIDLGEAVSRGCGTAVDLVMVDVGCKSTSAHQDTSVEPHPTTVLKRSYRARMAVSLCPRAALALALG